MSHQLTEGATQQFRGFLMAVISLSVLGTPLVGINRGYEPLIRVCFSEACLYKQAQFYYLAS